ncbi:unnamed protein product [Rotaria socialis]|uniref:C3H1-type domain-containing protein n=2 Tax=Rotaria socialis TaxID=392032 RepID=A0A821JJM8_9BILA|nr:unnamed protein product [Rotaria socialis]
MDIELVNTILRLCNEKQTCLFEVPFLCNYCLEQHLCSNPKYVLASIKNYMEIFKISRDKNRIEFFMPFEICRNNDDMCQHGDILCSNLHLCYDYFYTNVCRHSMNCPYPHRLTEKHHKTILGSLINLDLDILTKAFRVYCQSKKHLVGYNSLKTQPLNVNSTGIHNHTSSLSATVNNLRSVTNLQINGDSSWKTNNSRVLVTLKTLPKQQTSSSIPDQGVQICWNPQNDIQTHFIEVIFSNQVKSNGGPIQTHKIYQHLGVAQVFYQNSDIAERVNQHGPIKFQSFTFTPRRLQPIIDKRHVCFSNIPIDTNHILSYIDIVSMPYKAANFQYYENDKQTTIVEYNEDIDFSRISLNVRSHPECNGLMINCIQLYLPETLLVEYDKEFSEDDIIKMFNGKRVFHVKTYLYCSFVHFYSYDDLTQSINSTFDSRIRLTPIYINIYSDKHLKDYLQRRNMEFERNVAMTRPDSTLNQINKTELVSLIEDMKPSIKRQPSSPVLSPPPVDQKAELTFPVKEKPCSSTISKHESILSNTETESIAEGTNKDLSVNSDDETIDSEDDFHDILSDFDNEDLFLDEPIDDQGDMEYLRSAAKNLMTSLAEMEEASASTETDDTPRSLLYGDDYVVTIQSRRFTLAFLDYTQFRVEKQRNPDKFRLLTSLKKMTNKKRSEQIKGQDQASLSTSPIVTKTNKKKRNKRNKKKKNSSNHDKVTIDISSIAMDAFAKNFDRKKKHSAHADRSPRDGPDGMSFSTKRHFNNVKRKMFAFIDKKYQEPTNGMLLAPPSAHHRPPPSPMFVDQNKAPHQRAHFHTPMFVDQNKAPHQRAHFHTPALPRHQGQLQLHKQLPHLALATPQMHRRQ